MKRSFLLTFFCVLLQFVFAQKITLSGVITDANSGEQMMGVYVVLTDTNSALNPQGCVSNRAGFYSVSVYPGTYMLKISFMGYKTVEQQLELKRNTSMNFALEPEAIMTDEVVVTGQSEDHNVTSVDVGKMDLKVETIKKMPAFLGEADVIKTV